MKILVKLDSLLKLENLENVSLTNKQTWWKFLRLPLDLWKIMVLHKLARLRIRVDNAKLVIKIGDLMQLQK